jgi:hypothetical protein
MVVSWKPLVAGAHRSSATLAEHLRLASPTMSLVEGEGFEFQLQQISPPAVTTTARRLGPHGPHPSWPWTCTLEPNGLLCHSCDKCPSPCCLHAHHAGSNLCCCHCGGRYILCLGHSLHRRWSCLSPWTSCAWSTPPPSTTGGHRRPSLER